MPNTWILVADSGSARVFTVDSPTGPLQEREDYASPEARVHERDLGSDTPGRSFDSRGHHRHALGKEEPPQQRSAMNFARLLAGRVSRARTSGELERLIVVAAPEFLGLLREALDDQTRKQVERELPLNLVALKPQEIRARLPERLYSEFVKH